MGRILSLAVVLALLPKLAEAELPSNECKFGTLPFPSPSESVSPKTATAHRLAVFYVVPTDVTYSDAVYQRLVQATRNVQAWYQCATGGLTWTLAFPEVVHVYHALHTREYYRDNGDWWGSLLGEMQQQGAPIWTPGYVCALLAQGAGWWAGGAQSCGVDCGVALLGVESFPEFNNPAYSGGNCPGGTGVAAWPCTPEGAYAHELGHTFGLPHPTDVPARHEVANHSVMQTHWNYPIYAPPSESPWGFLTLERQTMNSNPFLSPGIGLVQVHPNCDVVNLPNTGIAPTSQFQVHIDYREQGFNLSTVNNSTGAVSYYWTFGNGSVSAQVNPAHSYATDGYYAVTLRASAANAMMSRTVMTNVTDVADVGPTPSTLKQNAPNPFGTYHNRTTRFRYQLAKPALVRIEIHDLVGRRVATLVNEWQGSDSKEIEWNGRDAMGRRVASGVYYCVLRAGDIKEVRRCVLAR